MFDILETKQSDLTVGQGLKISIAMTAVAAAIPIVIMGTSAGVSSVRNKIKEHKNNKKNSPELVK